MARQWVARRYQPGDEAQILQLRRLVLGDRDEQRNTEEYWRWEFRDNPAGHGRIWLAVAEGKVIGQYPVKPVRIQHSGEVILATICLDLMTHPDYRRQSVFAALGDKLYEELEREDIPVTYVFPNESSLAAGRAKHDWILICSAPVFVKPLDVSRIMERFISNRALASPIKSICKPLTRLLFKPGEYSLREANEIRWVDRFDDRIDAFWRRVAPKYPISVIRDSTYLNWRYLDNPGRQYRALIAEQGDEILGFLMLRCMEQFGLAGGMIVDLGTLPDRESVLGALLAEAERYFKEQGMDLVACLINGDDSYIGAVRDTGFLALPNRLGFKEWYFAGRLNTPALDKEFFIDPSNWFLTFGDTDIV